MTAKSRPQTILPWNVPGITLFEVNVQDPPDYEALRRDVDRFSGIVPAYDRARFPKRSLGHLREDQHGWSPPSSRGLITLVLKTFINNPLERDAQSWGWEMGLTVADEAETLALLRDDAAVAKLQELGHLQAPILGTDIEDPRDRNRKHRLSWRMNTGQISLEATERDIARMGNYPGALYIVTPKP